MFEVFYSIISGIGCISTFIYLFCIFFCLLVYCTLYSKLVNISFKNLNLLLPQRAFLINMHCSE